MSEEYHQTKSSGIIQSLRFSLSLSLSLSKYIYIYIYIKMKRFLFLKIYLFSSYIRVCFQLIAFVREHIWRKAL